MSPAGTMTSTIQRPSRPPLAPPTGPLPALPVGKNRKPLPPSPDSADASEGRRQSSASLLPTPVGSRSVTPSSIPTPRPAKSHTTPNIPTLSTTSVAPPTGLPSPGKTLRKTTSIGAFPVPPKGTPRVSSLPPSPLSASTTPSESHGPVTGQKRDSTKHRSDTGSIRKPKPRSSGYGLRSRASESAASGVSASPSLLNGTGENKSISSAAGARGSDALLSLPSPPQSRASSANDSYITEGTAFEDVGEEPQERGRRKSAPTIDSKRDSGGKDGKGNVLVSVRVRPDAGGG